MATVELAAPPPPAAEASAGSEGAGGLAAGGASADSVVIHPYLYPHATLKLPGGKAGVGKQLRKLALKGPGEKEAGSFADALHQARHALATVLESPTVGDAAVHDAVRSYLALLHGLVAATSPANGANGATNGAGSAQGEDATLDDALAAAEVAAAPPGGASQLRHAVAWEWGEAALAAAPGSPPRTARSTDAAFERASVLVAAALRLAHAAAAACTDSPSGVPTPATTRAYRLLREAAGMLEAAGRQAPALPGGLSADLDAQLMRALSLLALADAQQLTVLRAIQKGNAPALIAALAADTAQLFGQAGQQLGSSAAPGAGSSKLWQYAQYKQAYCLAYAHTFNGIALWKADRCGDGLKCLEAAAGAQAAAKRAASAYDAAPPASLNLHHRRVDEELERVLSDTQRRMQRENDSVFLQRIPAEAPPLPAGKRLVSALPYALPPPAEAVRGGVVERCFAAGPAGPADAPAQAAMPVGSGALPAGGAAAVAGGAAAQPARTGDAGSGGCSCCRVLAFAVAAPLLAVLWLLGALIHLLLLPLKCCCPCLGLPLGWLADAVLWLMGLLPSALLWATGSEGASKAKAADDKKR